MTIDWISFFVGVVACLAGQCLCVAGLISLAWMSGDDGPYAHRSEPDPGDPRRCSDAFFSRPWGRSDK